MTITVVTVTYSPGDSLALFLDSLEKATTSPVEVILADNGSVDGSVDAAVQRLGVRVVPTGGNVGYGRAVNVGVAASSSDLVVVANPDVTWEPGSLDELIAGADRWPRAGSLGPMITTGDGAVYPSARALPSLGPGHRPRAVRVVVAVQPWTAAYRRERGELTEGPTGWLSGLVPARAPQPRSTPSPASTRRTSCTSRTSTWASAWARPAGRTFYVPSRWSGIPAGTPRRAIRPRMAVEHHRSAWIYLAHHYSGWRWRRCAGCCAPGWPARSMLAKRVRSVAEGAATQRKD